MRSSSGCWVGAATCTSWSRSRYESVSSPRPRRCSANTVRPRSRPSRNVRSGPALWMRRMGWQRSGGALLSGAVIEEAADQPHGDAKRDNHRRVDGQFDHLRAEVIRVELAAFADGEPRANRQDASCRGDDADEKERLETGLAGAQIVNDGASTSMMMSVSSRSLTNEMMDCAPLTFGLMALIPCWASCQML